MKRTLRIIAYLAVFGVNLYYLWFLHSYFNMAVLVLLLLLPIISIVATSRIAKRTDASWEVPYACMHKGEEFFVRLKIDNPTPFGLMRCLARVEVTNLFYDTPRKQELIVPLRGRKGQEVTYPVKVERCGMVEFALHRIELTDWFGFASFGKDIETKASVVILPKEDGSVDSTLQGYQLGMEEVEESYKKGNDFSEVQDVREYQPGDKLQNIHWKLSAKRDILMVKERVSMSSKQLFLLVELYRGEELEEILDCAYTILRIMMKNRQPVSLVWWSELHQNYMVQKVDYEEQLEDAFRMLYYDPLYLNPGLGREMYRRVKGTEAQFLWVGPRSAGEGEAMITYGKSTGVYYGQDLR